MGRIENYVTVKASEDLKENQLIDMEREGSEL